jgi:type II secretory ATPase GspE/PulE/Tfp pilus assembly ATPase PilB-like protein
VDTVELLLEKKVISEDQVRIASTEANSKNRKDIVEKLIDMGFVSASTVSEIFGGDKKEDDFDLKTAIIDPNIIKKVPKSFANKYNLIPVKYSNKVVTVAMSDIFNIVALDRIKDFFPNDFKIETVYFSESDIIAAIDQYYGYELSIEGILKELEKSNAEEGDEVALKGDYTSPMVRLIDSILADAIHVGASDLHFEPEESFLRLRYRVDGKMAQVRSLHKGYWPSMSVRLKIMSGMNIAETRKPQDGRINSQILGRKIDFRVSAQPTIHGENFVMRILDEKGSILSLQKLGFLKRDIAIFNKLVKKPEGMIILTGPTGSGKTTTLYTLLNKINDAQKNIMTLEDPVEYRLPLIRQSNIKHDIGLTFSAGIRSLLRQDPDVILVGEIRDKETAIAATQAAMTGHQVYSSLHTNDAVSAIPRLINMGVPAFLLSGSVICLVAQRLARKLCPDCKTPSELNPLERKILGKKYAKVKKIYKAKGCSKCGETGYKGRVVIAEIMQFDEEVDYMVSEGANRKKILDYSKSKGFVTMDEDGIEKVVRGLTDFDELMRVVNLTHKF